MSEISPDKAEPVLHGCGEYILKVLGLRVPWTVGQWLMLAAYTGSTESAWVALV